MDIAPSVENHGRMPGTRQTQATRKFYLAEWLARLGRRPVDLATYLDVGESYISNLRSEKRSNPSIGILLDISDWLGITVNDLFQPPPKAQSIKELRGYSPRAIEKLLAKPVERPPEN